MLKLVFERDVLFHFDLLHFHLEILQISLVMLITWPIKGDATFG